MAGQNATQNNFTVTVCSPDSQEKNIFKIFAHVLNMIFALVGNLALCLVVKKNNKLRKTMDYLIINNAIADLVIPLIATPRVLTEIITGSKQWQISGAFGDFTCKFIYFVIDICPMVSMLTFVFLTVSRFMAVVFPFHAARAPKKLWRYYIASSWVISLTFCAPYLFVIKLGPHNICMMSWDYNIHKIYSTTLIVVFIGIPLVIMGVMYSIMLHRIRKSARKVLLQNTGSKKRQKTTRQMTLLSSCIVTTFVVCWGPYFSLVMGIFHFREKMIYLQKMCYLADFTFAGMLLAFSNASITPCLCLFFIESYRNGLKRLLGINKGQQDSMNTSAIGSQRSTMKKTINDEKSALCTSAV